MITDDKKTAEKPVVEIKVGEKAPARKPEMTRNVDANTVVGDTKPTESARRDVPQEKKHLV
jgi:hypothetical protein